MALWYYSVWLWLNNDEYVVLQIESGKMRFPWIFKSPDSSILVKLENAVPLLASKKTSTLSMQLYKDPPIITVSQVQFLRPQNRLSCVCYQALPNVLVVDYTKNRNELLLALRNWRNCLVNYYFMFKTRRTINVFFKPKRYHCLKSCCVSAWCLHISGKRINFAYSLHFILK